MLWWIPIPGVGMPGRDVAFMDRTQNIVSYVDRQLMPNHLYLDWDGPNAHNVRDPEGLLSDIPAIGTALMGVLVGIWLRSGRSKRDKFAGLALAAAASLALGYFWSMGFPLNKNMWTSSYVLVAGGYSLVLLALIYWAVELRGWRTGWTFPWLVFGSNAIAAYMISELVPGILYNIPIHSGPGGHGNLLSWGVTHSFAHIPYAGWAAFAYSVSFTALIFIPVWVLYRKKIFLKV
jgi:predicted acyltransferase